MDTVLTGVGSMRGAILLFLNVIAVIAVVTVMLLLHPTAVRAQDPPPPASPQGAPSPVQCWEIVAPMRGADPPTMVMLNRCTGDTWLLAKVSTREATATAPGSYVYRWRPISKAGDASETDFPVPSVSLR